MIDRATIARLLFTAPRVVERLRNRTLRERQKRVLKPIAMSVEELEAITSDLDLLYRALAQTYRELRALRTRGETA